METWIEQRPLLLSPLRLAAALLLFALLMVSNLAAVARWPFSAVARFRRRGRPSLPGEPIHVDQAGLQRLLAQEHTVVVDFWAEWCGPCLLLNGILKDFAKASEDVLVAKVDTTLCPSLAKEHRIDALPTLVLFRAGQEVKRHVGPLTEAQLHEFASSN